MVGVATPRKIPSSVMAKGLDWAIALLATAVRTQAIAAVHTSRDDKFPLIDFPAKIMTLPFPGRIASMLRGVVRQLAESVANYSSAQVLKGSSKLELNIITFIYMNRVLADLPGEDMTKPS